MEGNIRSFLWREADASFYEVFVAEFFLTQTPAENVVNVYPQFVERFPSLEAVRRSNRKDLKKAIEPLGFHRMRSESLVQIASECDDLPREPDELVELPRVGSYVANATVCFALERRLPILERNVVRVYRRVFGDRFPSTEREQREFAREMLPESSVEARRYNLALLDFGALVCEKLDPRCSACFATDYCEYYADLRVEGRSDG